MNTIQKNNQCKMIVHESTNQYHIGELMSDYNCSVFTVSRKLLGCCRTTLKYIISNI